MLGQKMAFPVYISAAAKGGLAHADAEEALCRAAYAKKTIQMCPHMATKTLEQVILSCPHGAYGDPWWHKSSSNVYIGLYR